MTLVYFAQAGHAGPIKIGVADEPETRVASLQTGNHETLVLLATALGGIAYERELHDRFADWRVRGEWFAPDAPGLTEAITEALHVDTLLTAGAPVCGGCGRRPVVAPHLIFCSDECARVSAVTRSRDWKRSARSSR